jgi:hypothetical protein
MGLILIILGLILLLLGYLVIGIIVMVIGVLLLFAPWPGAYGLGWYQGRRPPP